MPALCLTLWRTNYAQNYAGIKFAPLSKWCTRQSKWWHHLEKVFVTEVRVPVVSWDTQSLLYHRSVLCSHCVYLHKPLSTYTIPSIFQWRLHMVIRAIQVVAPPGQSPRNRNSFSCGFWVQNLYHCTESLSLYRVFIMVQSFYYHRSGQSHALIVYLHNPVYPHSYIHPLPNTQGHA